ncbi:hypothetical protein POM88_042982 [Heracleum sosnowskyi]|uniref:Replication factor A C-terminal domain-containing protein n=1 Tax=Heracleum sosnowskyi TaxID=360622 RepID=A0AAD8HIW1_9APIA|nr:hypothetical protein POM88_042982 [Heracleum sosnowskyi]
MRTSIDQKKKQFMETNTVLDVGRQEETCGFCTAQFFVEGMEEYNDEFSSVQEVAVKTVLEMEIPAGKDVVRCLCKGRIMEILNGNGWHYNCCTKCARAVHLLEAKYYCNACTEDDTQVTQRYRVVVRIEDGSGSTTLILFNKEAEQLIGVPLQKLLARP